MVTEASAEKPKQWLIEACQLSDLPDATWHLATQALARIHKPTAEDSGRRIGRRTLFCRYLLHQAASIQKNRLLGGKEAILELMRSSVNSSDILNDHAAAAAHMARQSAMIAAPVFVDRDDENGLDLLRKNLSVECSEAQNIMGLHIAAVRSCHKMRILSTGFTASVRRHEVEGRSDAIDRRLHLRDSDHLMKHKKAALEFASTAVWGKSLSDILAEDSIAQPKHLLFQNEDTDDKFLQKKAEVLSEFQQLQKTVALFLELATFVDEEKEQIPGITVEYVSGALTCMTTSESACVLDLTTCLELAHLTGNLMSTLSVWHCADDNFGSLIKALKLSARATGATVFHAVTLRAMNELAETHCSHSVSSCFKDWTEVVEGLWQRDIDIAAHEQRMAEMKRRGHWLTVFEDLTPLGQDDHDAAFLLMELARASTWFGAQEKQFYDLVFEESELLSAGSRRPLRAQRPMLEEIFGVMARQVAMTQTAKSDNWWQAAVFRANIDFGDGAGPVTCSEEAWKDFVDRRLHRIPRREMAYCWIRGAANLSIKQSYVKDSGKRNLTRPSQATHLGTAASLLKLAEGYEAMKRTVERAEEQNPGWENFTSMDAWKHPHQAVSNTVPKGDVRGGGSGASFVQKVAVTRDITLCDDKAKAARKTWTASFREAVGDSEAKPVYIIQEAKPAKTLSGKPLRERRRGRPRCVVSEQPHDNWATSAFAHSLDAVYGALFPGLGGVVPSMSEEEFCARVNRLEQCKYPSGMTKLSGQYTTSKTSHSAFGGNWYCSLAGSLEWCSTQLFPCWDPWLHTVGNIGLSGTGRFTDI